MGLRRLSAPLSKATSSERVRTPIIASRTLCDSQVTLQPHALENQHLIFKCMRLLGMLQFCSCFLLDKFCYRYPVFLCKLGHSFAHVCYHCLCQRQGDCMLLYALLCQPQILVHELVVEVWRIV